MKNEHVIMTVSNPTSQIRVLGIDVYGVIMSNAKWPIVLIQSIIQTLSGGAKNIKTAAEREGAWRTDF